MFVFHTLSAGNIGQPAAPGTLVPAVLAARCTRVGFGVGLLAGLVRVDDGVPLGAADPVAPGAPVPPAVGAVAQPARKPTAAAASSVRRNVKCPVRMVTVASWQTLGTPALRSSTVQNMAARPLRELVAPDWAEALAPVEARIGEL